MSCVCAPNHTIYIPPSLTHYIPVYSNTNFVITRQSIGIANENVGPDGIKLRQFTVGTSPVQIQ